MVYYDQPRHINAWEVGAATFQPTFPFVPVITPSAHDPFMYHKCDGTYKGCYDSLSLV